MSQIIEHWWLVLILTVGVILSMSFRFLSPASTFSDIIRYFLLRSDSAGFDSPLDKKRKRLWGISMLILLWIFAGIFLYHAYLY
jgi:hypothetical protein